MKTDKHSIDILKGSLEGSNDVQLAPIKGQDLRRELPKELFKKHPYLFICKLLFAFLLIILGWLGIWFALYKLDGNIPLIVGCMILCGLMYAHLIELQHECLHAHAFKSSFLNRACGVICGLFMFSSHSHYRYDHLRHHAYLGTDKNLEHFDYRFNNLNSIKGFIIAFFDLTRYRKVFKIIKSALNGTPLDNIHKKEAQKHIKQEYLFYFIIFCISIIVSIYKQSWFFCFAWWLSTLFIAEGAHFMIEMPEHYGLNTQTNPDVL